MLILAGALSPACARMSLVSGTPSSWRNFSSSASRCARRTGSRIRSRSSRVAGATQKDVPELAGPTQQLGGGSHVEPGRYPRCAAALRPRPLSGQNRNETRLPPLPDPSGRPPCSRANCGTPTGGSVAGQTPGLDRTEYRDRAARRNALPEFASSSTLASTRSAFMVHHEPNSPQSPTSGVSNRP